MMTQKYKRVLRHKKTLRGFSLAESLLAMFVLSVGLLTVVALFHASLRYSLDVRDGIIASQLAQEGIELVRNVRDNNFADGGNGFNGPPTTGFSSSDRHCSISYADDEVACYGSQGSIPSENLDYTGADPYYHTTGSTSTRFVRYLYIDYDDSDKTAHIKSFVVWGGSSLPPSDGSTASCFISNRCVYAEAVLTSWLKP